MAEIRPLTTEALLAAARTAAELHQTRDEANHYEPGSDLWHQFNDALRAAEAELHAERREREACTC